MPKAKFKVKIVKSESESKEKGIRVKCPKCGAERVLEDIQGWFYVILRHTFCRVCGTKIEMEEG